MHALLPEPHFLLNENAPGLQNSQANIAANVAQEFVSVELVRLTDALGQSSANNGRLSVPQQDEVKSLIWRIINKH